MRTSVRQWVVIEDAGASAAVAAADVDEGSAVDVAEVVVGEEGLEASEVSSRGGRIS